jgi:hypothetical protein
MYRMALTGTFRDDRPGFFSDHFVTAEDKIRELCTQVLAAETTKPQTG